jgi:hypothetical protein
VLCRPHDATTLPSRRWRRARAARPMCVPPPAYRGTCSSCAAAARATRPPSPASDGGGRAPGKGRIHSNFQLSNAAMPKLQNCCRSRKTKKSKSPILGHPKSPSLGPVASKLCSTGPIRSSFRPSHLLGRRSYRSPTSPRLKRKGPNSFQFSIFKCCNAKATELLKEQENQRKVSSRNNAMEDVKRQRCRRIAVRESQKPRWRHTKRVLNYKNYQNLLNLGPADGPPKASIMYFYRGRFGELAGAHDKNPHRDADDWHYISERTLFWQGI